MADNQFNIALSHGALAASSGWSLVQCMDLKFARIAFGLYLVNGVVGLVTYAVLQGVVNEEILKKVVTDLNWLCYMFCLPLIVAELYRLSGADVDTVIYAVLPLCILFTYNIIALDFYNMACIYGVLVTTSPPLGTMVALSYALMYVFSRDVPHVVVDNVPCPLCQYCLAVINLLTVCMLLSERQKKYS
ncbi:uncharacterized protein LOC124364111 isoform X1 [Homalodisca vitripennis]|uniref:uncharacterized protein LOC124364111 isoform X1 n=1 Tax=Homalodisca vitripennis TaxID=197043 RepID=UPI001EE9BBA5|nr:uncharacterized protein LOC124364111 isoform X1 [Homalodisca vitripennis]